MLLVSMGFDEEAVWDMPMDKFNLLIKSAQRVMGARRSGELMDTIVAIGSVLGGKDAAKSTEKYFEELTK